MRVHTAERLDILDETERASSIQRSASLTLSDRWITEDSSFIEYCQPRSDCTTELATIVTDRLFSLRGSSGIDLAGGTNGNALQDLMDVGLLTNGLLTTLKDRRDDATKEKSTLKHVSGDLLRKETWGKIIEWAETEVDEEGLSLVMHRPIGTLQDLSPDIYSRSAHFLLDMLRPGGVMLCQVPLGLLTQNRSDLAELQEGILARTDVSKIFVDTSVFFPRPAVILKNR